MSSLAEAGVERVLNTMMRDWTLATCLPPLVLFPTSDPIDSEDRLGSIDGGMVRGVRRGLGGSASGSPSPAADICTACQWLPCRLTGGGAVSVPSGIRGTKFSELG